MDFEDDDISKAISEAIDTHGVPSTEPPTAAETPAPAPAAKAPDGERARDETGKFTKQDAPPAAEDKKELAAPATGTAAQQPAAQPVADTTIPAPTNWKGNGKIAWGALSKDVQQALVEDYANVTKTQDELGTLKSAIGEERSQFLAANYGSVAQGIQNVLAGMEFANKNPTGFILWLAQRTGTDLSQLVQGAGQGTQPAGASDPLMSEVAQLRNQVQQFAQQQNQSQQSIVQSEISRFASDPAHPYFNDVRPEMAALMNQGSAKTLGEAYEMAVWAKPNIRTGLLEAERKKAFEANAAKVAQATNAQVSITGSPAGAKPPDDESDQDLEATLRKNVERAFA